MINMHKNRKKSPASGIKSGSGNPKEALSAEPRVIREGYARKGDVVAVVEPKVPGKPGRNVLGEQIPPPEVHEPHLVAGRNIMVEKGTLYYMEVDGIVQVSEDERSIYHIRGKMYRHGRCIVSVSDDRMTAMLSVIPPLGGARAIEPADAFEEISRNGVVFGVDEKAVEETVMRAQAERIAQDDVVIARGRNPKDGRDGKVEFKMVRASGSTVTVLGDGRVDFKEQDLITNIEEGQLIAILKKEQEPVQDGSTVLGDVIKAQSGRPVNFETGTNIRVEDLGEEIHYYSKIGGQLISDGMHISVEPMLVIKGDVGTRTGNISFEGDVLVKGSVNDSFNVYSKKDITIEGNVGNCVIRAGRNITVKNGVLGKNRGLVSAGGTVTVKFAENSTIQAGETINVQRAALNCRFTAGGKIVAVWQKGQIIGGELRAKDGLDVKILGNESEHRMDVYVGTDFFLEMNLQKIRENMKKYDLALQKIVLLIEKLERAGADQEGAEKKLQEMYEAAFKKRTAIKIALSELKNKEAAILGRLDVVTDARVVVRETLFRGVRVSFGSTIYETEEAKGGVSIRYNKDLDRVEVRRK